MLKEHVKVFAKILVFVDACVISAVFVLSYVARSFVSPILPLRDYFWFLPILLLIWGSFLHRLGMYKSFRMKDAVEVSYIVLRAGFYSLIVFTGLIYFMKVHDLSRGFISVFFLSGTFLLICEKVALLMMFRFIRKKGYNTRTVVVVGTGERAMNFAKLIEGHSEWGFKILGFLDIDKQKVGQVLANHHKVIGSFEDLPDIVHRNVVDEVAFVVPRSWLDKIDDMIYLCETEGIRVEVAVDLFEMKFARAKQSELHGFPLLTFESAPDKIWQLMSKRLMDIAGSFLGLIVLLIPFFVTAVIIKMTSKGPVFFRQLRSGLNGRKFTVYKFRTMYEDAEEKLKDLKGKNEMKGPVFKIKDDPRITPVGKFMRKLSIDEFPQLWNVFKGEMSLVGPRPPLPSEVNQYDNWHRRRLSMRPGITCLWQIRGRNKITDFNEWMRLDLEYIDNWSLLLDIKILIATVPVVLFGIGAH